MSFSASSVPLVENEQQQLSKQIMKISSNVVQIRSLMNTDKHELTRIIRETKDLVKTTSQDIKEFSGSQMIKKKLSHDFEQVLVQFQQTSKQAAQASRDIVVTARQHQQLLIAEEEAQEDAPLLGQQMALQQLDTQVEFNEQLIQEREQDLVQLEQSIAQVNEIFRDLGTLVNEQQFLLDNIESNVNDVNINMENAASELTRARNYQKNSQSWLCWIFLILLIVTSIFILALQPWKWFKS